MTDSTTNVSVPQSSRVNGTRVLIVVGVLVAIAGFAVPWVGFSRSFLSLLTSATATALLATGVGFLVRHAGFSSFGHAAYFGGAAYLLVLLSVYTDLPGEMIVLIAPIIITVAAFGIAFIMLRTEGVAFSMLSLALAQAMYELMMRWRDIANGEDGLAMRLPREIFGTTLSVFQRPGSMFLISWTVLIVVIILLALLARSRFGTLTLAIKGNEERARFIGYRTLVPRALVIAISACVAALGGTLFALYNGYVTPGILHWSLSGEALIIAIIGGTRSLWGPAVGAFIFVILRDFLGDYTTHWQSIVGLVLIAVVLLLPEGLSGLIKGTIDKVVRRTT